MPIVCHHRKFASTCGKCSPDGKHCLDLEARQKVVCQHTSYTSCCDRGNCNINGKTCLLLNLSERVICHHKSDSSCSNCFVDGVHCAVLGPNSRLICHHHQFEGFCGDCRFDAKFCKIVSLQVYNELQEQLVQRVEKEQQETQRREEQRLLEQELRHIQLGPEQHVDATQQPQFPPDSQSGLPALLDEHIGQQPKSPAVVVPDLPRPMQPSQHTPIASTDTAIGSSQVLSPQQGQQLSASGPSGSSTSVVAEGGESDAVGIALAVGGGLLGLFGIVAGTVAVIGQQQQEEERKKKQEELEKRRVAEQQRALEQQRQQQQQQQQHALEQARILREQQQQARERERLRHELQQQKQRQQLLENELQLQRMQLEEQRQQLRQPQTPGNVVQCLVCRKQFTSRAAREQHCEATDHDVNDFVGSSQCHQCGKMFSSLAAHQQHSDSTGHLK